MSKKSLLTLFIVSVLIILFLLQNNISSNSSVLAVNTDSLILEMSCASDNLIIEPFQSRYENEEIYYYFLPSYLKLKDITMHIGNDYSIRLSPENESSSAFVKNNNDNCDLIEVNELYNLTFLDNTNTDIISCKVRFLQSNLPSIFVNTESGNLDYINNDKNNKEKADITILDSNGIVQCKDSMEHITGRGNQTWLFDKKSYSIKLSQKINLFNMGEAKDWILLCNVVDDSNLRNKLTYDMAIAANMPFSPESVYVDLFMNGKYHGLYMLCEKIEVDPERVAIPNLDKENLVVNNLSAESPISLITDGDNIYAEMSNSPKDITGGYIIERDVKEKYLDSLSGFKSRILGDYYTLKNPEYATKDELSYIQDFMEDAEKAITSTSGINNDTGKKYTDYIDINSFVKKYIIEELSSNDGGGATSAYYYKPSDAISTKLFAGPVWDYDKAYGNGFHDLDDNPEVLNYLTLHNENTLLYWYLCQKPEFMELAKKEYTNFFSDYLGELVNHGVDEYTNYIAESAFMNKVRWHYIEYMIRNNGSDIYESTNYVKDFIKNRKEFLDNVWINNSELCNITLSDEGIIKYRFSVIKGTKLKALPDFHGQKDYKLYDNVTNKEFNINTPINKNYDFRVQL